MTTIEECKTGQCVYCEKHIEIGEIYTEFCDGRMIHTEYCIFRWLREALDNELEHTKHE